MLDEVSDQLGEAHMSKNYSWPPQPGTGSSPQPTGSQFLNPLAIRMWILPAIQISVEMDSSSVNPSDEYTAQITPDYSLGTLSKGPSQAVLRLVTHKNCEMINAGRFLMVTTFLSMNVWLVDLQGFFALDEHFLKHWWSKSDFMGTVS